MPEVVLDSSAILAVLFDEPGRAQVVAHLPGALVSTVNIAEAITKLCERGMTAAAAELAISELHLTSVPLSSAHARMIGELRAPTKAAGLSLGDRACLALGLERDAQILTSDRAWLGIDHSITADVVQIR